MSSKKNTVMTEVQTVQDKIQHTYHRIGVIEKKLAKKMATDSKESLEHLMTDLSQTKQRLKKHEENLLKLRRDNTKSFIIASCFIFLIFLIYGLYSMIFNIN